MEEIIFHGRLKDMITYSSGDGEGFGSGYDSGYGYGDQQYWPLAGAEVI